MDGFGDGGGGGVIWGLDKVGIGMELGRVGMELGL